MWNLIKQFFTITRQKVHVLKIALIILAAISAVLGVVLDMFAANSGVGDFAIMAAWITGILSGLSQHLEYVLEQRELLEQRKNENQKHEVLLEEIRRAVSPFTAPVFFCDVIIKMTDEEEVALTERIGESGLIPTEVLTDPRLQGIVKMLDELKIIMYVGTPTQSEDKLHFYFPLALLIEVQQGRAIRYSNRINMPLTFSIKSKYIRITIGEQTTSVANTGAISAISDMFGQKFYVDVEGPILQRNGTFGEPWVRFDNGQRIAIPHFDVPGPKEKPKTTFIGVLDTHTRIDHQHQPFNLEALDPLAEMTQQLLLKNHASLLKEFEQSLKNRAE